MSEKEKQIMKNFEAAIPKMTELEKEKLLSFGEGMAFMAEQRACEHEERREDEEKEKTTKKQ